MALSLRRQLSSCNHPLDKASFKPHLLQIPSLCRLRATRKDADTPDEGINTSRSRPHRTAGTAGPPRRRQRPASAPPQSPPATQIQANSTSQIPNATKRPVASRDSACDADAGGSGPAPTSNPRELRPCSRKATRPTSAAPAVPEVVHNATCVDPASPAPDGEPMGASTGKETRAARARSEKPTSGTPGQGGGVASVGDVSCNSRSKPPQPTVAATVAPDQTEAAPSPTATQQRPRPQSQPRLQEGMRSSRGPIPDPLGHSGNAALSGLRDRQPAGQPGGPARARTWVPSYNGQPRSRQAQGRQHGSQSSYAPPRRSSAASLLRQWGLPVPSGGDGAASMVAVLTSLPARTVAAAARSLSVDYPVLTDVDTADAAALAVAAFRAKAASDGAAAAAAAGAAAAAIAPEGLTQNSTDQDQHAVAEAVATLPPAAVALAAVRIDSRNPGVGNWVPAKGSSEGSSSTGERRDRGPEPDLDVQGVIWPLLPDELRTLAGCRTDPCVASSSSSGGSSARSGERSSNHGSTAGCSKPDRGARHVPAFRTDPDPDRRSHTAVLAAATTLLDVVSCAILERGLYPTRLVATKLRAAVQSRLRHAVKTRKGVAEAVEAPATEAAPEASEAQPADTAAATEASLLSMWAVLRIPHEVPGTVTEIFVRQAPYMSGCQVAAALAAVGALAQPLGDAASGALADRALELLAVGMPRLEQIGDEHEEEDGRRSDDRWARDGRGWLEDDRKARGGVATGGANGHHQRLEGLSPFRGAGSGAEETGGMGPRPEPLAPPLAALLMLLLAAVLPRALSQRQVRWVMWGQLQAIMLPLTVPATGDGGDGHLGALPPPQQQQQQQQPSKGPDHRGAARLPGTGVEAPDAAVVRDRQLSFAAARQYCSDGGDVEATGSGVGEVDDGGSGPPGGGALSQGASWREVSLATVGALLITADRLQVFLPGSHVEDRALQQLSCLGARAGGLPPRQLATVLRSLTDQQVLLGSDVLWRFVARLSAAARSGHLGPAESVAVLGCLSCQVYGISRKELAGLTRTIFKAIEEYARIDEPAATGSEAGSGKQKPYTLPYLATLCGEIEAHLGQLPLPSWSHPDRVLAVREALARFAASGGARPKAMHLAWRAFVRSPSVGVDEQRPDAASPDDYIEAARRDLLSLSDVGESMLERVLSLKPGIRFGPAADSGSRPGGLGAVM